LFRTINNLLMILILPLISAISLSAKITACGTFKKRKKEENILYCTKYLDVKLD